MHGGRLGEELGASSWPRRAGPALVDEAERISRRTGVFTAVSNSGGGKDEIEARIHAACGRPSRGGVRRHAAGSCFFAAMHLAKADAAVRVVTGVNLPMLLDFVYSRPCCCLPKEGPGGRR
ncbi:MAG: hypothetical protein U0133_04400 [Gemmatimonadales bacterium]